MLVLDQLYSIGKIRRALWRGWYGFLTRRVESDEILFLNYAFEDDSSPRLPLRAEDELHRACIQLYHHVAAQVDNADKVVLEVSCGHGGGAAYLARTFRPRRYTGLDLNSRGIRFCRRRHAVAGLDFIEGDAEALPLADASCDTVINIEASHCYGSFPKFLAEVSRVLRPGGHFLYADFRFADGMPEWDEAIANSEFCIRQQRDISAAVLRGMNQNSARSQALVARHLPRFLQKLGSDFAGVQGSRVYDALKNGELTYRSYCFEKLPLRPSSDQLGETSGFR